ncbi:MAG: hypothetical protein WCK04_00815 [Actinomycetes bacterium]
MGLIAAGVAGAALMVGGAAMSAGKKVKVPQFQRVNTENEQEAAIKQNIASLQSGSELATKTTASEQTLLESQLRRAIPGYDQLISQAGKNIGSNLRGEISTDVQSQLQRSAAGRALSGGFGAGSGVGRNLSARDFGLTSMQIQNQGLQQAQSFIQQQRMFGMVQPFSTSSMFISPTQRINLSLQENQFQFNRDMAAAQVAAQPDPMMAAIGGSLSNIGGMAFGGVMGGMMGGGGGGGGQGRGGGGGITLNYGGGGGGGGVGYNPYGSYQPNMYSSPYGGYGVRY